MYSKIRGYYAELFPSYPVLLVSPRKANIRIASRKLYVDFPYIYWQFIGKVIPLLVKSKSPQKEFEKQWKRFISDEEVRKIATFEGKPLGTVSLNVSAFSPQLLLKLKVNWPLFFSYLEERAKKLISEVGKDGSSIREVYNEIIANYYGITPRIVPDPTAYRFNPHALEGFKKFLRRCEEEKDIQHQLKILLQTVEGIEKEFRNSGKRNQKSSSMKLWTLQLKSDIYGVEGCLENADILSCYFYLRNLLENLVKLVVYNDIARHFGNYHDEILRILFFYEKIAKKRCFTIQSLKKEYGGTLNKVLQKISTKEADWEGKVFQEIEKEQLPKLSIKRETLTEFQGSDNFDSLGNYWSACSEVMHNQSPLPFFSLLEVKAFKCFLKKYVECFNLSLVRTFKISEELIKTEQFQEPSEEKIMLTTRAKKVLHTLSLEKEMEIKNIISSINNDKNLQKETFFDPLTLVSLFHLSSPGWARINSGEFDKDDVEYLVEKVKPLSFKGEGIKYYLNITLEKYQEKMRLELERISREFSKLNDEEKKAVVFNLLTIELPELIKEKISI